MNIHKSVLSSCLLLLMACTQAEHIEQPQRQKKHIDKASTVSQPEAKPLISIDQVLIRKGNFTKFADAHIADLLKAADAERIECKDAKGHIVQDHKYPNDKTSIDFWRMSDGRWEYIEDWKGIYMEIKQLSQSKNLSPRELEPKYLVLNAYSLKEESKYPVSVTKVGAAYVSSDNKFFQIKLLDGTSAYIEVFKDIPYYYFADDAEYEYNLANAPDYSPYYFNFWFDGDREKQTCRLKYTFVD